MNNYIWLFSRRYRVLLRKAGRTESDLHKEFIRLSGYSCRLVIFDDLVTPEQSGVSE